MPRYFKSTANKPGGGVRKGYRRGGRNLRDEEARVIGVQDNAADELRRVRARRPHDAAERRDRRAQLLRVGSRERNARDEMARLRQRLGRQIGGIVPDMSGVERQVAALGPELEAMQQIDPTLGNSRLDRARRSYEWSQTPEGAAFQEYMNRIYGAGAAWNTQPTPARREPGGDLGATREGRRYQYGGRVGFKTGGRISRKKKGAKFI